MVPHSPNKSIAPNQSQTRPSAPNFYGRSFVKRMLTPAPLNTASGTPPPRTTSPLKVNLIKTSSILCLTLALCAFAGGSLDAQGQALGPLYQAAPHLDASPRHGPRQGLDSIRRWNQIAIDASGFDHANAREQLGPCRASRAM